MVTKTLKARLGIGLLAGLLSLTNLSAQTMPSPIMRSIPDTPAYSKPEESKKEFPNTLMQVEYTPSKFQIEDDLPAGEFQRLFYRTGQRVDIILEDKLNSNPNLWINRSVTDWNDRGKDFVQTGLEDAFKYSKPYKNVQNVVSRAAEWSAEKITFGFSYTYFRLFKNEADSHDRAEELSYKAGNAVSDSSVGLDIGTDRFKSPFVRAQPEQHNLLVYPNGVLIGAGRDGYDKAVLTKFGGDALDIRLQTSLGDKAKLFIGAGIDSGLISLHPKNEGSWSLKAGLKNRIGNYDLTLGVSSNNYFKEDPNHRNEWAALAIVNRSF